MWPRLTTPLLGSLLLTGAYPSAAADDPFDTFPEPDLESRIAAVNDGELRFLAGAPDRPVHRHRNEIEITASSLEQGWVTLRQCHRQLDPVAAAEILFHEGRARNIRVLSSHGIGKAWPHGASLQLEDIEPGAELCLSLESRALESLGNGRYRLRSGPYMRRFLDGYYPLEVRVRIGYPADLLILRDYDPIPQPGYRLETAPGLVLLETRFEGKLYTRFDFCLHGDADCAPKELP